VRSRPAASLASRLKAVLLARLDPGLAMPVEADENARILPQSHSFLTTAVLGLLEPFSVAYGAGVMTRNWLYKTGKLKTHRPACPTVCVGNITAGGTGKTPAVILVCQLLREMGKRPAVLSRGYGRSERAVRVLTAAELEALGPRQSLARFGDEVLTIAGRLHDLPIVVSADRAAAARAACETFAPDVLVMDDGFGHLRLQRDLDILMFDARWPFANGRLLPRGLLREPLWAIERAKVAIVSRTDQCSPEELAATDEAIRRHNPDITLIHSVHRPTGLTRISDQETLHLNHLSAKKVLAFCGIAHPKSFFSTLSRLGAVVTGVPFPDHHIFTKREIARLVGRRHSGGFDLTVTTEKDAPRLFNLSRDESQEVFALAVEIRLLQDGVERLQEALAHAIDKV